MSLKIAVCSKTKTLRKFAVNGTTVEHAAPHALNQFKMHPLGEVNGVIVFDDDGNFMKRWSDKDFLSDAIQ